MHITGGLGAVHGIEGFGEEYKLPNLEAYNETCAAVANVFFNYRMFLLHQDAKYFDIAELSLFNNALVGINIKGDLFFYENPLECDGIRTFNKGTTGRAEWFGTACCPPNISRLILQTPGYMYSYTSDKIYLTLYAGSKAEIPLKKGIVTIRQTSDYPFNGKTEIIISSGSKQKFSIYLRIPSWASQKKFVSGGLYSYSDTLNPEILLTVNGERVSYEQDKGFAVINRKWEKGDKILLDIPMPIRFVKCHPSAQNNLGHVALTRGPLVYCAEEVDNGRIVQMLFLPEIHDNDDIEIITFTSGVLTGIPAVRILGKEIINNSVNDTHITLIPYYSWNNRQTGPTMMVWIPENREHADNKIQKAGSPDSHGRNTIRKTDG